MRGVRGITRNGEHDNNGSSAWNRKHDNDWRARVYEIENMIVTCLYIAEAFQLGLRRIGSPSSAAWNAEKRGRKAREKREKSEREKREKEREKEVEKREQERERDGDNREKEEVRRGSRVREKRGRKREGKGRDDNIWINNIIFIIIFIPNINIIITIIVIV